MTMHRRRMLLFLEPHAETKIYNKKGKKKKRFYLNAQDVLCIVRMLTTNVLLYFAVNLAGMYTKYLTDRGQRQAFLETHRSMETRQRTQNENNRQEKLLLSGRYIHYVNNAHTCQYLLLKDIRCSHVARVKYDIEVVACKRQGMNLVDREKLVHQGVKRVTRHSRSIASDIKSQRTVITAFFSFSVVFFLFFCLYSFLLLSLTPRNRYDYNIPVAE